MNTNFKIRKWAVVGLVLVVVFTFLSSTMTVMAASEITEEKAKEIALTTVGGGTVTKCIAADKDGSNVYSVTIIYGDKQFKMNCYSQ